MTRTSAAVSLHGTASCTGAARHGSIELVSSQTWRQSPVAPRVSMAPPLKWAGGKRWQVPRPAPLWRAHPHRRLVEPFCGGLAVTLGLMPDRALLNDINPHLINFYAWLKRGLCIEMPLGPNRR